MLGRCKSRSQPRRSCVEPVREGEHLKIKPKHTPDRKQPLPTPGSKGISIRCVAQMAQDSQIRHRRVHASMKKGGAVAEKFPGRFACLKVGYITLTGPNIAPIHDDLPTHDLEPPAVSSEAFILNEIANSRLLSPWRNRTHRPAPRRIKRLLARKCTSSVASCLRRMSRKSTSSRLTQRASMTLRRRMPIPRLSDGTGPRPTLAGLYLLAYLSPLLE